MAATPTSELSLFNLRESPYFQDALQASSRHPLSLFVGREDATGRLLKKIEMNPGGTRQTIRGPIGVGKSTLAAYVKTEAAYRFGLLSAARPPALAPLTDAESAALLDKRCTELRADLDQPFRRPVEAEAVTDLYNFYGGDLRGTFEALDAAISQLLGTSIHGASASLSLGDMAPFLTGWAQEQAQDQLGERGLDDLTRLAQSFGNASFTRAMLQKDIMHTKNIATAAEFTDKLLRFGYIAEYPERLQSGGRPAVQYLITGTTRLVIGTAYTWDPPA